MQYLVRGKGHKWKFMTQINEGPSKWVNQLIIICIVMYTTSE